MMRRIAPWLVFVGLCATAVAAAAQDGIMLAHRFEVGASQRYRVRFSGEADMGGMTMSQLGDMEVTVKCASVADGKNSMELKFDKVEMSRSMFGKSEGDPRGEKLVGSVVTFVVDRSGTVSNIKTAGYVEGWNELRGTLEPLVKDWYVYLPGEKVAVGGEWKQENVKETVESGVEVTKNSRFKLKELKKEAGRDCAFVVADVDNKFGGKVASPAGEYNVSGGGKGKYEFCFDPAAGVVVRYKGKMDVEMEMNPTAGNADAVISTISYQFEKELL